MVQRNSFGFTTKQMLFMDFYYGWISEIGTSPMLSDLVNATGVNQGNVSATNYSLKIAGVIRIAKAHGSNQSGSAQMVYWVNHPIKGIAEIEETIFDEEYQASYFRSDYEAMAQILNRNCLNCSAKFEARSKFLRLCPKCRSQGGGDYTPAVTGGYFSNAYQVSLGNPSAGIGGFKRGTK